MADEVKDDIEAYLKEISQYKLLTSDEEKDLARRIAKGDKAARDRMISSNLRLVVNIAKHYSSSGMPLLDLIAEGNFGLMKAADRFRPDEGASFSTYASWWIKQAVRRAINAKVKNVRVPAYMADIVSRWRRVSKELSQGLERSATPKEIAEAMRLNPDKIAIVQQAIGADSSSSFRRRAHKLNSDDEYTNPVDELAAPIAANSTGEALFGPDEERKMELLLSCLEPREEKVLRYRYGFGTGQYLTLQAIGTRLKLTRERVRQIEAIALRKALKVLGEEQ
ncbi:MAG: sigma-70 family RNA polymerase sigma factor [Planctomycetota bacterium]|jgi:RNA polymerase primary sigma factor